MFGTEFNQVKHTSGLVPRKLLGNQTQVLTELMETLVIHDPTLNI